MLKHGINIPGLKYGETGNFLLIAGPCVVEGEDMVFEIADHLVNLSNKFKLPFVFKASYRKANRSKADSFTELATRKHLRSWLK